MKFQMKQKILSKCSMKIMGTAIQYQELKIFFIIAQNLYRQKWLLRYNTNELYTEYKFEHPNNKIYWSTFESLHLKRCITVAATGSPSVCLCLYHQKVKLMLDGCKFPVDQHSLIEMIVCSRSNCGKSPWLEPLYEHWL